MTVKAQKRLSMSLIVTMVLIPIVVAAITGKINLGFNQSAVRINKIEAQCQQNTTDIQVIRAEALKPEQVQMLLKANNNELLKDMFEKGYIRTKCK